MVDALLASTPRLRILKTVSFLSSWRHVLSSVPRDAVLTIACTRAQKTDGDAEAPSYRLLSRSRMGLFDASLNPQTCCRATATRLRTPGMERGAHKAHRLAAPLAVSQLHAETCRRCANENYDRQSPGISLRTAVGRWSKTLPPRPARPAALVRLDTIACCLSLSLLPFCAELRAHWTCKQKRSLADERESTLQNACQLLGPVHAPLCAL